MKALILCGGLGTRLGKLTKNTPKPMIMVGGKPVIQHIVDRLNKHGIKDIIIKVHYLPDQIIKHIGDKAIYYYEPALLDYKESLENLSQWLGEEFLLINGDTINEIDYTDMIAFHQKGTITAAFDDWRAQGTWIYDNLYFTKELQIRPYRSKVNWFDIGRPDRLEAARMHYEVGEKRLCP